MVYGIDFGHNNPFDTGAVGYKTEDTLNAEVGTLVIQKLKFLGHTVFDCTGRNGKSLIDSLAERCEIANINNVDVFVSIHFNAGGGHGTEVFAISSAGKQLAESIVDSIASLGYTNRGVKNGSKLYVLKYTKMPAVLVECAFVDSKEDMNRYNSEDISEAIVKGLTEQTVIEEKRKLVMLKVKAEAPSFTSIPEIIKIYKKDDLITAIGEEKDFWILDIQGKKAFIEKLKTEIK